MISGGACLRHDFWSRHERGSCTPAERVKRIALALAFARLTHSGSGGGRLANIGRGACWSTGAGLVDETHLVAFAGDPREREYVGGVL